MKMIFPGFFLPVEPEKLKITCFSKENHPLKSEIQIRTGQLPVWVLFEA